MSSWRLPQTQRQGTCGAIIQWHLSDFYYPFAEYHGGDSPSGTAPIVSITRSRAYHIRLSHLQLGGGR